MNHIIDELKQFDTKFMRVPNDESLCESAKLYVVYFKIANGKDTLMLSRVWNLNLISQYCWMIIRK